MGLLKRLFHQSTKNEEVIETKKDINVENSIDRVNQELLQEAIQAGDEEGIRYYTRHLDKEYRLAEEDYWRKNVELEEMRVDKTISKDAFEKACNEHMLRAFAFKPLWEKYNQVPFQPNVFKIYALFLEREGRYVDAATVCAKALRWGFPNDRTQGGMAGRLVRMVKKSGGETNKEIEDALKKYCQ